MKKSPSKVNHSRSKYLKTIFYFAIVFIQACSNTDTAVPAQEPKHPIENKVDLDPKTSLHEKTSDADSIVQFFFSHPDSLEKFISSEFGVYCIEPGPGASPVLEKLEGKEGLMGKTSFMFMIRDLPIIKNKTVVSSSEFDPCMENLDGYHISDVGQPQTLLHEVYHVYITQHGTAPDIKLSSDIKIVDSLLLKCAVVSFKEKHGEPVFLKLYFLKQNKNLYLSIIDLRDCGA